MDSFEPDVSNKAACILLLLLAYFKEPKDAIVLEADVSIFIILTLVLGLLFVKNCTYTVLV